MSHPHKETITVVAKTYPECSRKYGCLVCTAGVTEDGEWRRLYPIPWYLFWSNNPSQKLTYKKWDIIRVSVEKAHPDYRAESYKVIHPENIETVGSVEDWESRRRFCERYLDEGMEELWKEKRSLGVIKPSRFEDFIEQERQKASEGEENVLDNSIQALLPEFVEVPMDQPSWRGLHPQEIPWIGYHYQCAGLGCNGHKMMCIDWEIQELYRREGFEKCRAKALDWMRNRDLFLGVGTTWDYRHPKSWMIISLVYPPKRTEKSLFEYG